MSRHVIIRANFLAELDAQIQHREQAALASSTPAEIPAVVRPIATRRSHALDLDRLREFHALVRDYRQMQSLFEETQDPVIRREAAKVAEQLDAEVGWLAADFAAHDAHQAAAAVVEGGGL